MDNVSKNTAEFWTYMDVENEESIAFALDNRLDEDAIYKNRDLMLKDVAEYLDENTKILPFKVSITKDSDIVIVNPNTESENPEWGFDVDKETYEK